jgi:hypothetical protein
MPILEIQKIIDSSRQEVADSRTHTSYWGYWIEVRSPTWVDPQPFIVALPNRLYVTG